MNARSQTNLFNTYDDDNGEILEIVVQLIIWSLKDHFNARQINKLAIAFSYQFCASLNKLKVFFEIDLPKLLTASQRDEVLMYDSIQAFTD